jgi:hypothetical protein
VTAEVALVAATAKTVLQILAATNQAVKVLGWGVYFDGTSSTGEPVVVELIRQTTAGTMSALTAEKIDPGRAETIQTTCTHTATAEPSTTTAMTRIEVHPQSAYEKLFPFGQEIIVPGAGRLGLRCTAPAGVNVVGFFRCEE